jgi:hypothetical protein
MAKTEPAYNKSKQKRNEESRNYCDSKGDNKPSESPSYDFDANVQVCEPEILLVTNLIRPGRQIDDASGKGQHQSITKAKLQRRWFSGLCDGAGVSSRDIQCALYPKYSARALKK